MTNSKEVKSQKNEQHKKSSKEQNSLKKEWIVYPDTEELGLMDLKQVLNLVKISTEQNGRKITLLKNQTENTVYTLNYFQNEFLPNCPQARALQNNAGNEIFENNFSINSSQDEKSIDFSNKQNNFLNGKDVSKGNFSLFSENQSHDPMNTINPNFFFNDFNFMNQSQQNGYSNDLPRNLNNISLSSDGELQLSKTKKNPKQKKKINLNNQFKEEQISDANPRE